MNWFPDLDPGTYTGQNQAAWSVTGNSQYVVLGGEFPTVNGAPQQGLVRFGVPAVAPNKQAPMVSGSDFKPTLRAVSSTSVRVSWPSNWDRDDQNLTYQRGAATATSATRSTPAPVSRSSGTGRLLGYVDKGLSPGTSYDYRLNVTDSHGNLVWGDTASITTPTTSPSSYAQQIPNDNGASYWRLGESSGSTAYDSSGANDLSVGSGVGRRAAGAIIGDPDTASTFSGSSSGYAHDRRRTSRARTPTRSRDGSTPPPEAAVSSSASATRRPDRARRSTGRSTWTTQVISSTACTPTRTPW